MTKDQLIAALQALDVPGETEVLIHQVPSATEIVPCRAAWVDVRCDKECFRLNTSVCLSKYGRET